MSFTVDATYESGVLKLHQPLPLDEHQTVRVTVQTDKSRPAGDNLSVPRNDAAPLEPAATAPANVSTSDEPSDFAEYEMVDLWIDVPPSPAAITVIARRGPLPLPDPPAIPPSDDDLE